MQGKRFSYISSLMDINSSYWVVDSGAARRICFEQSLFTQLHVVNNVLVYLPNQSCIEVAFAGSVKLSAELELHDVLYIPSFRFNLISVGCLLHNSNLTILFSKTRCLIQDPRRVIGKSDFH